MEAPISPFAQTLKRDDPRRNADRDCGLRDEVNARLDQLIPPVDKRPERLHAAMRHGLLGQGKRIRPIICIMICEAAGGANRSFALDAGCAVEMVHSASLILDDLPSMDDATLRRGSPATHVRFGEATAILAAIGLLNRAFGLIAEHPEADPELKAQVADALSQAVGSDGMIAGQEIDLNERSAFDRTGSIENLNWLKTGVLFVAAAHIGALAARLTPPAAEEVKDFARHIGLAFQTADDLIDQTVDREAAGKDVRQDDGVPTLITLCGLRTARLSCQDHIKAAGEALQRSGLNPEGLQALMHSIFAMRS